MKNTFLSISMNPEEETSTYDPKLAKIIKAARPLQNTAEIILLDDLVNALETKEQELKHWDILQYTGEILHSCGIFLYGKDANTVTKIASTAMQKMGQRHPTVLSKNTTSLAGKLIKKNGSGEPYIEKLETIKTTIQSLQNKGIATVIDTEATLSALDKTIKGIAKVSQGILPNSAEVNAFGTSREQLGKIVRETLGSQKRTKEERNLANYIHTSHIHRNTAMTSLEQVCLKHIAVEMFGPNPKEIKEGPLADFLDKLNKFKNSVRYRDYQDRNHAHKPPFVPMQTGSYCIEWLAKNTESTCAAFNDIREGKVPKRRDLKAIPEMKGEIRDILRKGTLLTPEGKRLVETINDIQNKKTLGNLEHNMNPEHTGHDRHNVISRKELDTLIDALDTVIAKGVTAPFTHPDDPTLQLEQVKRHLEHVKDITDGNRQDTQKEKRIFDRAVNSINILHGRGNLAYGVKELSYEQQNIMNTARAVYESEYPNELKVLEKAIPELLETEGLPPENNVLLNTKEKPLSSAALLKKMKKRAKNLSEVIPGTTISDSLNDLTEVLTKIKKGKELTPSDMDNLFSQKNILAFNRSTIAIFFPENEIEQIENLSTTFIKERETRGKLSTLSIAAAVSLAPPEKNTGETPYYTEHLDNLIDGLTDRGNFDEEIDTINTAADAIIDIADKKTPEKDHLLSLKKLKETLIGIKNDPTHEDLAEYAETLLEDWPNALDILCDHTTGNLIQYHNEVAFLREAESDRRYHFCPHGLH
jgi:hypothetical protein